MKVWIKGAGDLATGVACRLHNCGFEIIMTELNVPTSVRRAVCFSRAVYEETATVEGVTARLCEGLSEALACLESGQIPVLKEPDASVMLAWRPDAVVDAILAKRNTGTKRTDAPAVVALGPGFEAGRDCHCVVETLRGHDLGRCIYRGGAAENTGVPGEIAGVSKDRLLRAPCDGSFEPVRAIGDLVNKGDICATVGGMPVTAGTGGVLRGLLQADVPVTKGMKAGDVDPRGIRENCFTVSDKARAVGGGVLEALLTLARQK